MQHSYEALDRPGGVAGAGLFSPLRHRDFRVLWAGMAVSLLGDGIFLIAVAWEAYSLWNAPMALALVGIGMTVPTIVFLVPGGVVTDRLDRRTVMLTADVVRAAAVAVLAVLAFTGSLRFWELVALVAVYGAASAFFIPAFDAVVPDLLPSADLAAANSLDQFVRPIALRLAGPALGGLLVSVGTGVAFAVDAASFAVSGVAVLMMHPPPAPWRETAEPALDGREVRASLRPAAGVALGHAPLGCARVSRLPRPGRGAAALRRQERPPRVGRGTRPGLRGGRPGSSGRCDRDGAASGAAPRTSPSCT